jgi:hypothetical protein
MTPAVIVFSGCSLWRGSNVKNPDRPHEIELRATDVDVRAVLDAAQGKVHGNEIAHVFVRTPNGSLGCGAEISADLRRRLIQLDATPLEQDIKEPSCVTEWTVQFI